jgi:TctA family transporter
MYLAYLGLLAVVVVVGFVLSTFLKFGAFAVAIMVGLIGARWLRQFDKDPDSV